MNQFTYIYILQSVADPNHFYVGRTQDLRARLLRHNSGKVRHTAKWKPWRLKTYVALSDSSRGIALEGYLKSENRLQAEHLSKNDFKPQSHPTVRLAERHANGGLLTHSNLSGKRDLGQRQ